MSVQPVAPAEADLIRQRRESAEPALSRRQAAARAGISPSQWGDVERGSKTAGSGVVAPVRATAETLARMARAIGVSPEDFEAAGREDAASLLRNADAAQDLRHRLAAIPGLGVLGAWELPGIDGQEVLPLIAAGLDAIDSSGLPASARRELASMFTRNLLHDAARRHSELLLMLRLAAGPPCGTAKPGRSPRHDQPEEADQHGNPGT